MASKNKWTCSDKRISASCIWSLKFSNLCKLCLQTSGTGQRKRVSNCSKGNSKQLLHGRFHQISRSPGRRNWSLQSTTTSSLTTWIWTEEVDKQKRCSYQSNPRRLEVNQQHEASRSATPYRGILSARTTMDRYWWQFSSMQRYKQGSWSTITQRKILSLVTLVFDPIGLIAPFSVHMRRLPKSIWTKNGQHWDSEVEPGEEKEFLRWKQQLPIVAETSIGRRYFNREKDRTELHVFADASEDTMCAVAYLRSQPNEYSANLEFVIGNCRVAPMRHLSIPRLELQAAVMAVWLKEQIVKEHEMKINNCSFWSDLTTLLQWIHSSQRKQPMFVANRVAEILDTTDVSQWKQVSGINNPADIGTSANNLEELKRSEWLTGPAWLKRPDCEWLEQVNLIFASDEENKLSSVFTIQAEEKKAIIQWERFSNFNRLVNTVAYVQRALNKHKPSTFVVSIEETEKAKSIVFKLLQQEQFGEQMKSLKVEKEIPKGSKILQFSPFLDEEGLTRAKGRIGKSQLDFNAKHPILLHRKHRAVELFLRNEHKNNQREGTEHVRNFVQHNMWIPSLRNALRSIKNKCVTCRKGRAQTIAPVIANLLEERLDSSTGFTNVGVDCFSPFIVKIGRRNKRRWCCLFTCLSMRAVHIEVVPKLDTDSCINAIMRFIARRGKPSTTISDNATNFVEAEIEISEYVAAWNKEGIEEHLVQRGIR